MEGDLEKIDATLQLLSDEKSEALLSLTYTYFFKDCPEAESLWEKDDPVSRGKMFNGVILTIVDNLTRPQVFKQNLQSDVKDHDGYGVNKSMYGVFFDSMVRALKELLGTDFDKDMVAAWQRQFSQIEESVHQYCQR